MTRHLLHRFIGTLGVLLAVSFVTFMALSTSPVDAANAMLGDGATAEQLDQLRASLDLDQPLLVRYGRFLANVTLRGDFGRSMVGNQPVSQLLVERLPYTVLLALVACSLALAIGGLLGITAALRAGSWLDTLLMSLTVLGLAVPVFWSALLLIMLFSLRLDWLPVAGAGSIRHLILPVLTLALPTSATIARLIRSSLQDTLRADYVRTAHAKGLTWRRVLGAHVLRNSLIPVLTVFGLQVGHLLGGAFVVETIFGWPGLGRLTVQAIFDQDVPVVMGAALMIATFYLLLNFLVDVAQGWLDPRIAHEAI